MQFSKNQLTTLLIIYYIKYKYLFRLRVSRQILSNLSYIKSYIA